MTLPSLTTLLFLAGIGQLALVAGSLAIPRVLHWREETAKLNPLTHHVFWTYAAYIWMTNLSFGLLSTFAPSWLAPSYQTRGTGLAGAVTTFIAIYWGARLLIQLFWRQHAPQGNFFRLGEAVLVSLFVAFTLIYAYAAVVNWEQYWELSPKP